MTPSRVGLPTTDSSSVSMLVCFWLGLQAVCLYVQTCLSFQGFMQHLRRPRRQAGAGTIRLGQRYMCLGARSMLCTFGSCAGWVPAVFCIHVRSAPDVHDISFLLLPTLVHVFG